MPRPGVPNDRRALAAVIEALIFAGEEPLPPRTLLRLLYDDPKRKTKKSSAPLLEMVAADGEEQSDPEEETEAEAEADQESGPEESGRAEQEEIDAEILAGGRDRIGQKELREIIDELNGEYEESGRSFRIIEIAGGFQFATTKEYGEWVGLLSHDRAKRRLSPAALETISIVAYRQPVTKPEIESIRGVNCDQVLVSLLERELITIVGRAESVGRPLLYGTTDAFLRAFGLNSLSDLPKLRELEELMEDDAVSAVAPTVIPTAVQDELLEENLEEDLEEDEEDVEPDEVENEEVEIQNEG